MLENAKIYLQIHANKTVPPEKCYVSKRKCPCLLFFFFFQFYFSNIITWKENEVVLLTIAKYFMDRTCEKQRSLRKIGRKKLFFII